MKLTKKIRKSWTGNILLLPKDWISTKFKSFNLKNGRKFRKILFFQNVVTETITVCIYLDLLKIYITQYIINWTHHFLSDVYTTDYDYQSNCMAIVMAEYLYEIDCSISLVCHCEEVTLDK